MNATTYLSHEGHTIAASLNCSYDGIWDGYKGIERMFQFTDNVTHGTFTVTKLNYETVKERLEKIREEFHGENKADT